MTIVSTANAPVPLGHYSQAIIRNNVLYVSGQLPMHPTDTNISFDTPEEQTIRTLQNVEAIVKKAGGTKQSIVKTTIFITDINLWGAVNEAYASFFGEHKPARSAVPVVTLPKGFVIEIEAIAHI